jgi:hypothetical protein
VSEKKIFGRSIQQLLSLHMHRVVNEIDNDDDVTVSEMVVSEKEKKKEKKKKKRKEK